MCKEKLLCYMGDESDAESEQPLPDPAMSEEVITADLSYLYALEGHSRSKPFHVIGAINEKEVRVLFDIGATMDFLHPRIAAALQLDLTPIRPFRVLVGNGASLLCTHVSRQTSLTMQGSLFTVDLHILDHHGPDVILGMAWVESLGKIQANFVDKTLEFYKGDKRVFLQGVTEGPKRISLQSLALLSAYSTGHEFYEIVQLNKTEVGQPVVAEETFPPDIPDSILQVLERHRAVFSLPRGMPPARQFDHRIH